MQKHTNRFDSRQTEQVRRQRPWRRTPRVLLAALLALLLTGAFVLNPAGLVLATGAEGAPDAAQETQAPGIVVNPNAVQQQPAATNPDAWYWEQPSTNDGGGTGGNSGNSGGSGSGGSNNIQLSSWVSASQLAWQVAYGTERENIGLPITLRALTAAGDTVRVPVRWRTAANTTYDGTVPATYVFTAYAKDEPNSTYWSQLMSALPKVQRVITVMPAGEEVSVQPGGEDQGSGSGTGGWTPDPNAGWGTDPNASDNNGGWVPDPNAGWTNLPGTLPDAQGRGQTGEPDGDGTILDAAGQPVAPVVMDPVDPTPDPSTLPEDLHREPVPAGERVLPESYVPADPAYLPDGAQVVIVGEDLNGTDENEQELPGGEEGEGAPQSAGFDWVIGIVPLSGEQQSLTAAAGTPQSDLGLPATLDVVLAPAVVETDTETEGEAQDTGEGGMGEIVTQPVSVSWQSSPAYDAQAWIAYLAAQESAAAPAETQKVAEGGLVFQQADAADPAIGEVLAEPPSSYTFTPVFSSAHVPVDDLTLPTVQVTIDSAGMAFATGLGDMQLFAINDTVTDGLANTYKVVGGTPPNETVTAISVTTGGGTLTMPSNITAATPVSGTIYSLISANSGAYQIPITDLYLNDGVGFIQGNAFSSAGISNIHATLTNTAVLAPGALPSTANLFCRSDMVYGFVKAGFPQNKITADTDYTVTLTGATTANAGRPYTVTFELGCAYNAIPPTSFLSVTNGTVQSVNFTPYTYSASSAKSTAMSRKGTAVIIPNGTSPMIIDVAAGAITTPFFGATNLAATAPLSVTVNPPTAYIDTVTVKPEILPYTGGKVKVTITGYNLTLMISPEIRGLGTTAVPITVTDDNNATATLTFPKNDDVKNKVYTLQIFENGVTTGITFNVTVRARAWIDEIKANKTRLYRGGGTVKVTIYGENLWAYSSLVIKTNGENPVYADVVKGSKGTRAEAYIKIGKNTTKGTLYYNLRLWADGVRTDHAVEVKQYNYYYDDGGSTTPTTTTTTLDYYKVYLDDQLGSQRGSYDLTKYPMDTMGNVNVSVTASTASHSYLVSVRELSDYIGKNPAGNGYLELNNTQYRLRIPYRVLMQPVTNPDGTTTEELLPNVTDYLRQNNLQTNNLWLRVGLTPMVGGGYQVVLSLEYQLRTSTTNAATAPLTTSVPVVLENLANPLQIGAPTTELWEPIPQSGVYTQPFVAYGGEKG